MNHPKQRIETIVQVPGPCWTVTRAKIVMLDKNNKDGTTKHVGLQTSGLSTTVRQTWDNAPTESVSSWAKKVSKCYPRSAGWWLSPKQEAPTSKVWLHTKLTMLYSRCLESAAPWAFKTTRQSKPTTDCPLKTGRRITKTKWLALNESCQWDIPHKSS